MCVVGEDFSRFVLIPSSLFGTLLLDRRLRPRYRHASDGAQITIDAENKKSVDMPQHLAHRLCIGWF